jgi:serine/threonine protein kinase
MAELSNEDRLLGPMLVNAGLIKPAQLEEALRALAASPGARLRDELVRRGWVSAEVIDGATEASIVGPSSTAATHPPSSSGTTTQGPSSTAATLPPPVPEATVRVGGPASTLPTVSEGPSPSTAPTLKTGGATHEAPGKMPPEVVQASEDPKNRFGKYVLVKQLGHGGMAVVYKAWDTFLSHFVALKFILTQDIAGGDSSAAQEQVDQFMAEARLAVRLNHPNIARVYELGKHEDKFYMAQFFIDGPALHEVIHGTRGKSLDTLFYQDPKRHVKVMRDIADAMAYAHGMNPPIIHRDLKPANVMLDSSGRAYVVDFGLAKELRVDGGSMSGAVKGTPKYMAPEQAEGRSELMDGRTDVWALGVILYEMLAGRPPFEDENIHRLLSKIINDEPSWPRHVVTPQTAKLSASTKGVLTVPKDLEIIAMKCLQKDRRHRYQNARELVEDLDRVLGGQEVSVPDHSIYWVMGRWGRLARKHRWTLLPVAALLAAVAGLGLWAWSRPPAAPGPAVLPAGPESAAREALRKEVVALRDAFLAQPSASTLEPLAKRLEGLEPVLAPVARQGIGDWWVSFASQREGEGSALRARSPRERLSKEVRDRAEGLLRDLGLAEAVNRHAKLLGVNPVDLSKAAAEAQAVLAWRGTFSLAVNLHPWAEVRVRVGEKDFTGDASRQENVTPLRMADLPVGAVRLDFAREGSVKTVEVPAAELRDGAVLRVWGTWDRIERAVE